MAHPVEDVSEPEFTLGDRLRKAREWAGIKSADRMAELLNDRFPDQHIGRGAVGAWERDDNQPTRIRVQEVVAAYADICKVSESFFWPSRSRCPSSLAGHPMRRAGDLSLVQYNPYQPELPGLLWWEVAPGRLEAGWRPHRPPQLTPVADPVAPFTNRTYGAALAEVDRGRDDRVAAQ